jgi:hypothetical protein
LLQCEIIVDFMQYGDFEFRFSVETGSHTGHWSSDLEVAHRDPAAKDMNAEMQRISVIVNKRTSTMLSSMNAAERLLDSKQLREDEQKVKRTIDDLHKSSVRCMNLLQEYKRMLGDGYDRSLQTKFEHCESAARLLTFLEEK